MMQHHSRWLDLAALTCILIFSISIPPGISSQLQDVLEGRGSWALTLITLAVVFGAWLISAFLLTTAAFSRPAVKWPIFILVSASFVGMTGYHEVAGRALEYPDYLILWQARANTLDALQEYAASAIRPLAYVAVLWLGFGLARPRRWASSAAVVLLCVSVGIFTGVCVAKRGAGTNKLPTTTGVYGLLAAYVLDQKNEVYAYTSSETPVHAARVQNIVLVIDESVRHDFFERIIGLGLRGAATHGWQVHDFGLATSMANCSAGSNIMVRKGVRSADIFDDLYRRPLIWSAAHNAGFTSYLLDVQGNGMGHNYFDAEERALIEHRLDVSALRRDAELLDAMPYLDGEANTFSLVIKHGAHFPYVNNYPDGFQSRDAAFRHPYVQASQRRQEYVNALSWQTGGFFDKLLSLSLSAPTMVIYTADHGQNVDDQPGLTHCTSSGAPYPGEGLVPLVILTNYSDAALARAAIENHNQLSHFNIVPTVLDVMGYESARVYAAPSAAVTVQQSASVPGFVYGSPFGYFGSAVQVQAVDRAAALAAATKRWAGE